MVIPDRFAPGMALQLTRYREALARGMPRRGWKIGINVPEVLRHFGLPHPGVGWLDGRKVLPSGSVLERRPDARLRVEPEVAISVATVVAPGCPPEDARRCIASVQPALEIVDYAKSAASLDDIVAHCMFHHATVLGPAASPDAARGLGGRLPRLGVGARSSDEPRSDLVPADLGEVVAFAAEYLAAFGESLEAGDLVLSGSYTAAALELGTGEEGVAEFGALGLVSVRIAP